MNQIDPNNGPNSAKGAIGYNSRSVLNPISPALLLIAGVATVIEIALQLGSYGIIGGPDSIGWRLSLFQNFAFQDAIFEHFRVNGFAAFVAQPYLALTFITYPMLHYSIPDAAIGLAIFLALGRVMTLRFSVWATLVLVLAGTIVAGIAYGVYTSSGQPLVGLFDPSCALIGAYSWTEYNYRRVMKEPIWPAFRIIFFLAIFQLVMQLFMVPSDFWVAQLAACAAGFGLSYLVAPGAARRIVARLRA